MTVSPAAGIRTFNVLPTERQVEFKTKVTFRNLQPRVPEHPTPGEIPYLAMIPVWTYCTIRTQALLLARTHLFTLVRNLQTRVYGHPLMMKCLI